MSGNNASTLTKASLAITALLFSTASAATIRVPADYTTIQAGIDASVDGDTVLVADGTYSDVGNRNLDYDGRAITVLSENGAESTVIECNKSGRGFDFGGSEDSTSILDGFTIRNGWVDQGGGIRCISSSPTIQNCILTENKALSSGYGGGLYLESSSSIVRNCAIVSNTGAGYSHGGGISAKNSRPLIDNCKISDNSLAGWENAESGGGIHFWESDGMIRGCVISGNSADYGGGIRIRGSEPTIEGCEILDNSIGFCGGGIHCTSDWDDTAVIRACLISGNSCNRIGGGISVQEDADPLITNCVITNNRARDGGGISALGHTVYEKWASPEISNCLITGNHATSDGGGLNNDERSGAYIVNCTIFDNSASRSGGGIYAVGSHCYPSIVNCIIRANPPGQIQLDWGSRISVRYSNIQGGWSGTGNINMRPHFMHLMGYEFLLRPESPCIDSGDPSKTDRIFDEHPRWPPDYPNGERSDMGAYGGERNRIWFWMRDLLF